MVPTTSIVTVQPPLAKPRHFSLYLFAAVIGLSGMILCSCSGVKTTRVRVDQESVTTNGQTIVTNSKPLHVNLDGQLTLVIPNAPQFSVGNHDSPLVTNITLLTLSLSNVSPITVINSNLLIVDLPDKLLTAVSNMLTVAATGAGKTNQPSDEPLHWWNSTFWQNGLSALCSAIATIWVAYLVRNKKNNGDKPNWIVLAILVVAILPLLFLSISHLFGRLTTTTEYISIQLTPQATNYLTVQNSNHVARAETSAGLTPYPKPVNPVWDFVEIRHNMLQFYSTLIWQIIVVACLWAFRSELKALLRRILSIKHGQTELLFQKPSPEAVESSLLALEALKIRDEEGFFTIQGIDNLVKESKYYGESCLRDSILVFSTEKQHTWLVATDSHIYFILDDERTRSNQRLIQTRIPLADALPVYAQHESEVSGSFRLGSSNYWYYSYDLLGKPPKATQRLTTFVNTAGSI